MDRSGEGDSAASDAPPVPTGLRRRLAVQLIIEAGPLLVFFITFVAAGLWWATAAYAVGTAAAFATAWRRHRRLPLLPAVSSGLVLIFAGLTLVLDDATFILIKPTVINGFYAVVLGVGWLVGFRLIERVLGREAVLDERGLRSLTFRTTAYLAALAAANELAWRFLPVDLWVVFKVFVIVGCNLVFGLTQFPLIRRHLVRAGPAE